jgi:chorismate mutase
VNLTNQPAGSANPEENEVSPESESTKPTLADLRSEIDRIDAAMHDLLIERGGVIDRLIEIKRRQGGGSAFRPAREAAMMRAIAERHRGLLPFETVEGIWRIIISTFTYVQAPYGVHLDVSRSDAAMRDSARFHFGFTVPCVLHRSVGQVIEAVRTSTGDLGMFAIDSVPGALPWWTALAPPDAPKVIARLPFVERRDHPAGAPVFVISNPLADGGARDVVLESVAVDRWQSGFSDVLQSIGAEVIGSAANALGLSLLIARPGATRPDAVAAKLRAEGGADVRSAEVGAHASRFEFGSRAQARAKEATQ